MLLCIVNESLGAGWSFSKIVHPFLPFYREFCAINKSQEMGWGRGASGFSGDLWVASGAGRV